MAKKAKRTKPKASEPPVSVEPDCTVELEFTDAVTKDPETVRSLAHRVVDLLADTGRDDRLAKSVSNNLAYLADDFVVEKVTGLLEEAIQGGEVVPPEDIVDFGYVERLCEFLARNRDPRYSGKFIHVKDNFPEWEDRHMAGDGYTLRRIKIT